MKLIKLSRPQIVEEASGAPAQNWELDGFCRGCAGGRVQAWLRRVSFKGSGAGPRIFAP